MERYPLMNERLFVSFFYLEKSSENLLLMSGSSEPYVREVLGLRSSGVHRNCCQTILFLLLKEGGRKGTPLPHHWNPPVTCIIVGDCQENLFRKMIPEG
jgi:hypothetical protein